MLTRHFCGRTATLRRLFTGLGPQSDHFGVIRAQQRYAGQVNTVSTLSTRQTYIVANVLLCVACASPWLFSFSGSRRQTSVVPAVNAAECCWGTERRPIREKIGATRTRYALLKPFRT